MFDAIVANKHTRQNGSPNLVASAKIQRIIDTALVRGEPIPISTVGGCIKCGVVLHDHPDLAEALAIETFSALNERICSIHAPGIRLTIRMEDLTEIYNISYERKVRELVSAYLIRFTNLVRSMQLPWVRVVPESNLVHAEDWFAYTEKLAPYFHRYLMESDGKPAFHHEALHSYRELKHLGWMGQVDLAARLWFRDRYTRLYGEERTEEMYSRLSYYLAGILTRHVLHATVAEDTIQIAMSQPMPLHGIVQPRVYYRTFPGHEHRPWWAALGAWCPRSHRPKLLCPTDSPAVDWEAVKVVSSRSDASAEVTAPILAARR